MDGGIVLNAGVDTIVRANVDLFLSSTNFGPTEEVHDRAVAPSWLASFVESFIEIRAR